VWDENINDTGGNRKGFFFPPFWKISKHGNECKENQEKKLREFLYEWSPFFF
jgi:hypothetical protein